MCDCSIRVTAVLKYLESAFFLPRGVVIIPYFHPAFIINTARPIKGCGDCVQVSRGVVSAFHCSGSLNGHGLKSYEYYPNLNYNLIAQSSNVKCITCMFIVITGIRLQVCSQHSASARTDS